VPFPSPLLAVFPAFLAGFATFWHEIHDLRPPRPDLNPIFHSKKRVCKTRRLCRFAPTSHKCVLEQPGYQHATMATYLNRMPSPVYILYGRVKYIVARNLINQICPFLSNYISECSGICFFWVKVLPSKYLMVNDIAFKEPE